eukprot:1159948-Pelagomonas_calceolata.AAC.12
MQPCQRQRKNSLTGASLASANAFSNACQCNAAMPAPKTELACQCQCNAAIPAPKTELACQCQCNAAMPAPKTELARQCQCNAAMPAPKTELARQCQCNAAMPVLFSNACQHSASASAMQPCQRFFPMRAMPAPVPYRYAMLASAGASPVNAKDPAI